MLLAVLGNIRPLAAGAVIYQRFVADEVRSCNTHHDTFMSRCKNGRISTRLRDQAERNQTNRNHRTAAAWLVFVMIDRMRKDGCG